MLPQRIISLVPSQTELLVDLGIDRELVGITKFCIHPAGMSISKSIVGGTKTLHLDRIRTLRPDLIIANKEENTRQEIDELQRDYPVHVTDIVTLPDALRMIEEVGTLVGKRAAAMDLAQRIDQGLMAISGERLAQGNPPLSVAYLIWRQPYMVAASDTFIHSMLEIAGFRNAFAGQKRYPEITADELKAARPDLVFLSSEPYPFQPRHLTEFQRICPEARVLVVDGELFSWYGSRLLQASDYFRNLHQAIAR